MERTVPPDLYADDAMIVNCDEARAIGSRVAGRMFARTGFPVTDPFDEELNGQPSVVRSDRLDGHPGNAHDARLAEPRCTCL